MNWISYIIKLENNSSKLFSGDSGGGLVVADSVIGIVSWNIPCARGFPDAYVRVSYMRDWILQAMNS